MNELEWQLLESQPSAPHIEIHGAAIVAGSRVRLCPHPGGDALDMMVYGKVATVASIEQDYEGHWQLSVVLDDDPGLYLRRHRLFRRREHGRVAVRHDSGLGEHLQRDGPEP